MKRMYVYILQCIDESYYTGVTNNIDKRFSEHQNGVCKSCYTYKRRPVTLVFTQAFDNPYDAIKAEKQIKGWSRKKKKALIEGDFELLIELSKCKNESSHLNCTPSSFDSAQDDINLCVISELKI